MVPTGQGFARPVDEAVVSVAIRHYCDNPLGDVPSSVYEGERVILA